MNQRRTEDAQVARSQFDDYVKPVAAQDATPASEIQRAKACWTRHHHGGGVRVPQGQGAGLMASGAVADHRDRVTGWWIFAAVMLGISGVLNVIWGIAAVSDSKFFVNDAKYVISSLHTWGWITWIIGALEVTAAGSLVVGGGFGRWMGILAASISAIASLLSIDAYPFWSISVFALSIIIIYQLAKGRRSSRT